MILFIESLSVILLRSLSWVDVVEWVDLCLWHHLLVERQIIGSGHLSSVELINLDTMAKQYIPFLAQLIGQHISTIHLLIEFGHLGLDWAIGPIWVHWFGIHRACYFGGWLIGVFAHFVYLPIRLFGCMLIYLSSQNVRDLLLIDIVNISSFPHTLSVNVISELGLPEPGVAWAIASPDIEFIGEMVPRIVVQFALLSESLLFFGHVLQQGDVRGDFLTMEDLVRSLLLGSFILHIYTSITFGSFTFLAVW